MRRRKFILGLGGAAAGGAAMLGSGAFSSVSAERNVSVEVVGDNAALLRMTPVVHKIEESDPATVFEEDDGLLTIDVTQGGASGVNADAVTWIGTSNFDDQRGWVEVEDDNIDWVGDHTYTPRAAFGVENRGTQEYDLKFSYEYSGDPGESEITFEFYDGAAPNLGNHFPRKIGTLEGEDSITNEATSGGQSFTLGKRIFSSIKIETGKSGDDLSGTLTITAETPE